MDILNLELLFLLAYIIEAIIQIVMLNRFKKSHIIKDWFVFLEINIIVIICDIFAYGTFANDAVGLSSAVLGIFVCGFILFTNSILLIIGLVIKNKSKDKINETNDANEKKTNKIPIFKSSIIILVCNLLILFIVPILMQKIISVKGEKYIISYLEQKYGNGNYKVVNVMKEYSNYGMWDKFLSGYYYEIKSDYMENTFIVTVTDNSLYIHDDYFLPVYYSQKYNLPYKLSYDNWDNSLSYDFDEFNNYIINSIKDKYSIEIDIYDVKDLYQSYLHSWSSEGVTYNPSYFIIPEDYGKIPSIDELDELFMEFAPKLLELDKKLIKQQLFQ